MRSIRSITTVVVVLAVLALAGVAAANTIPTQLSLQDKTLKVKNGRIVLTVSCASDDVCNSIVTARVPMPGGIIIKRGGLGGKIFKMQNAETKGVVFTLTPEVKTWLKSHRRTSLHVSLKATDGEYGDHFLQKLRIPLSA
jgi:hypothetical protein